MVTVRTSTLHVIKRPQWKGNGDGDKDAASAEGALCHILPRAEAAETRAWLDDERPEATLRYRPSYSPTLPPFSSNPFTQRVCLACQHTALGHHSHKRSEQKPRATG
jgi:hypothetical protein